MRGSPSRKGDKMYEIKYQVEKIVDKFQDLADNSKKFQIGVYVGGFICIVAMMILGQ